jgi:iron(III) transport system ATP-binding protein
MSDYVVVKNLTKTFGATVAVNDVSFSIKKGEFFTFLGPSGCGKTTLLRCIAGYEIAEKGQILIDNTDIRDIPANKRDIGFGFQNYALFPTMTVFKNITFGLEMRKVPDAEIKKKVSEIIELVGLSGLEGRKPKQLSGGQQQRVALARALVIQPRILLLDEPLSNLDAKLRVEMRVNITRIQKKLNITTIYVTHDQEEAFAVSDRILVMKDGFNQQVDVPSRLYYQPKNEFVANFIGQTNLIRGEYVRSDAELLLMSALGSTVYVRKPDDFSAEAARAGMSVTIRPEHISINPKEVYRNSFAGIVTERQFQGSFIAFYTNVGGAEIIVKKQGLTKEELSVQPQEGDTVQLGFAPEVCTVTQ